MRRKGGFEFLEGMLLLTSSERPDPSSDHHAALVVRDDGHHGNSGWINCHSHGWLKGHGPKVIGWCMLGEGDSLYGGVVKSKQDVWVKTEGVKYVCKCGPVREWTRKGNSTGL